MQAIIFDFDGVIIETEKIRFKTVQELIKEENIKLSEDKFITFIGKKTANFLKETFPQLSEEKIINMSNKRRELNNNLKYPLIKGIKELLEYLKKENKIIGLTTGSKKEFVTRILKEHNIFSFFSTIVCGEDFQTSKPNPECFILTLKKMNVTTATIIEDSPAGIQAGKSIGCKTFGLGTYFSKEELQAEKFFMNHEEIVLFLKNE